MKPFLNILYIVPILLFIETMLSSCTQEELEIQQNFPFEISVMPVPKDIAKNETVEIRCHIIPSGKYNNTKYYLRYFQFEGTGTLRYYNEVPYFPNDSYQLADQQFRLYYTSMSEVSQSFTIWITDSFGNEKEIEFQFNSKD